MSEVIITGISNVQGEERSLVHLYVEHNGNTYEWKRYVPKNVDSLDDFIISIKQSVLNEIDSKESAWADLEPKTRTILDPLTNTETTVPIAKEEIVSPSIPDYYTLRKNEYPSLGDQLDAIWKGVDSESFINMMNKIKEIKNKYPKPNEPTIAIGNMFDIQN